MRFGSMILALAGAAVAWSVAAQPAEGPTTDHYYAELDRQCPDSQLQLLSPGQLRDGVDDFMSSLPQDAQTRMRQAELARCSSAGEGVACVNDADIGVIDELGETDQFAGSICATFLRCRAQGDCESLR